MNIFHLINFNIPIRLNDTVRLNKHNMENIVMHVCITITARVCMFVYSDVFVSVYVYARVCAFFALSFVFAYFCLCVWRARVYVLLCALPRVILCA